MQPYLLLASPIHQSKKYIIHKWIDHISRIEYAHRDILLVDNSPTDEFYAEIKPYCTERLIRLEHFDGLDSRYHKGAGYKNLENAYNLIRDYTLRKRYDMLGFIECDNFPPLNYLAKWRADLETHRAGVIIAPYWNNGEFDTGHKLLLTVRRQHFGENLVMEERRLLEAIESFAKMDGRVKQVYGGGFGTLLMHTSVLRNIIFHAEDPTGFPDTFFFADCQEQRIKVIMDCSMPVPHANAERYVKQLTLVEN